MGSLNLDFGLEQQSDHTLGHISVKIEKLISITAENILLADNYKKKTALYKKNMTHLEMLVGPLGTQPIILNVHLIIND